MATEAPLPRITTSVDSTAGYKPITTVPLTIFNFPSFEPARLESWSAKHLHVPLRRDILHLAVIYEGDNTRQGTASSKNRWEVAGSHRKMRKQKGLGVARQGTRQSPLIRGGGKSFGPKPRDFGTRITRKVYDLAWRTALSYRYRRGELVVVDDGDGAGAELPYPPEFAALLDAGALPDGLRRAFRDKWVRQVLDANGWGRQAGRSTVITAAPRERLFEALAGVPAHGRALAVDDVDVKDLLETGRVVVEREALRQMVEEHQSDLVTRVFVENSQLPRTPESGKVVVE